MSCHRNIWDFGPDERARLAAAIRQYIASPGVVAWHAAHHDLHTSGYYFLVGHRAYLAGLETHLKGLGVIGGDEFVPMWDPSDPVPARRLIPPEFIDPSRGEGRRNIWAPLRPLVACSFFPFRGFWLRLWPPFPFPHPTFVPWTSFYGITLCWTVHFAVHVLVGGKFGQIPNTSTTPLFWLWHAFIDELYCGWEEARGHKRHPPVVATGQVTDAHGHTHNHPA